MEDLSSILDFSNKNIKKISKTTLLDTQNVTAIIYDDNEIQKVENLDCFVNLQKLSVERNQLMRMYGVCRLLSLHTLNLAHNNIISIEGLKELTNLKWLRLAGNNIRAIEHLNTNINLEYIDLSENGITHLNDLSFLKKLKELLLHNNKINQLTDCDRYLPKGLTNLTLANNQIADLNEISLLTHLTNLTSISIANNPCVNMTGNNIGFDYRPFVINWLMNVTVIDGYVVDAIESLRAEWLYSQGKGRHFQIGDHNELVSYLASVCPLTAQTLETEEDRKLRLILSKAQHHQQQLREQSNNDNSSPHTRRKLHGTRFINRQSGKPVSKLKSPDRMSMSCYSSMSMSDNSNTIMSQSFDPSMFSQTLNSNGSDMSQSICLDKSLDTAPVNSPLQALSKMVPVPESLMSPDYIPSPLANRLNSASFSISSSKSQKAVTPNAKKSQICSPKSIRTPKVKNAAVNSVPAKKTGSPSPRHKNLMNNVIANKVDIIKPVSILRKSVSSDDDSVCDSKLQPIQQKAEELRQQKDASVESSSLEENKIEQAAICIQKLWRGYYIRNKNKEVQNMFRSLQAERANQYIQKLATDMETTKAALESERKIQMLQTEAISALWKKVSALQPNESGPSSSCNMTDLNVENNSEVVKQLAQTCTVLQNQITQLQGSMGEIVKIMTFFSNSASFNANAQGHKENGTATQTEIVAVHTPQGESGKIFPFQKQTRPSSLPLPVGIKKKENSHQTTSTSDLQIFAGTLVEDALKTVSETKADTLGFNTTEILVTDTDLKDNKILKH